jgi:predicted MPP superfamily phosphohydrolase
LNIALPSIIGNGHCENFELTLTMIKIHSLIFTLFLLCFLVQVAVSQGLAEMEPKLFSFGVMADVQYADVDQMGKRNYRGSLEKLENSIELLNRYDLSFIASLGDLIDRHYESFEKPLELMSQSKAKIHHVLGNQDH